MPPLPVAIILLLAPFAPRFSRRVWGHAQSLLLGAILTPGARTVAAALRLFLLVTLLARQLSPDGQIPVPVTAWYHKAEPTFSDCLGLVRHHLWRARYLVHSTPEAECMPFPQEALDLLIHGLSLAA